MGKFTAWADVHKKKEPRFCTLCRSFASKVKGGKCSMLSTRTESLDLEFWGLITDSCALEAFVKEAARFLILITLMATGSRLWPSCRRMMRTIRRFLETLLLFVGILSWPLLGTPSCISLTCRKAFGLLSTRPRGFSLEVMIYCLYKLFMSLNKGSSMSRQSTPRKKSKGDSLNSLIFDVQTEKKRTGLLSSRISSLEKLNGGKFVTRSVTPLSSKLIAPYQPLDLSQVSKSSILHERSSIPFQALGQNRSSSNSKNSNYSKPYKTERISPEPVQSIRISQPTDSPITTSEKNIETLRQELQQRRELIVGLKETVSRKQLEHKYWALVSEIEETSSRLISVKTFNKELRNEIMELNSGANGLL